MVFGNCEYPYLNWHAEHSNKPNGKMYTNDRMTWSPPGNIKFYFVSGMLWH